MEDKGSLCKSSNTTIQSKLVAQIRDRYAVNTDGRPHQRRYLGGPIIVLGFLLGGSREGGIWLLVEFFILINRLGHIIIFLYVYIHNATDFSHMQAPLYIDVRW